MPERPIYLARTCRTNTIYGCVTRTVPLHEGCIFCTTLFTFMIFMAWTEPVVYRRALMIPGHKMPDSWAERAAFLVVTLASGWARCRWRERGWPNCTLEAGLNLCILASFSWSFIMEALLISLDKYFRAGPIPPKNSPRCDLTWLDITIQYNLLQFIQFIGISSLAGVDMEIKPAGQHTTLQATVPGDQFVMPSDALPQNAPCIAVPCSSKTPYCPSCTLTYLRFTTFYIQQ